jgi:hypothetical protein
MLHQLKEFYSIYGYYSFRVWALHILSLCSIVYLGLDYFVIGIIFFLLVMPLHTLIFHEWISHEYVQPRNKLCKLFSLFVFYSQDNTIRGKKNYHVYHHRHWLNQDLDPTYQKLKKLPWYRYVLGLQKPIAQHIPNIENSLLESSSLVKTLDKYHRAIYVALALILFGILPFNWFVTTMIWYPWLSMIAYNTHDYYFHGPWQGKDKNCLSIIFGTAAWHIAHHESWRNEYYGPGYWRVLSPGWYWRYLLFKTS